MKTVFLILGMILLSNCNIETNGITRVILHDTIYVCDKVIVTDDGQLLLYVNNNIKWIIKNNEYIIEQ